MTCYFRLLADHALTGSYIESVIDMIEQRKTLEAEGASAALVEAWRSSEADVTALFSARNLLTSEVPRCAATSCERAWDPAGGPLQICARCRKVYYCSRPCQKL